MTNLLWRQSLKNFPRKNGELKTRELHGLKNWEICCCIYCLFQRRTAGIFALTEDFENFEKLGAIMPPEDKDAALFPRRINGKWFLIHRPISIHHGPGAHIWISRSDDLKYWGDHQILIRARKADGGMPTKWD